MLNCGYFVRNPKVSAKEEPKTSTTCGTCGIVCKSQYGLMKHEREGCPALKPPKPPAPKKSYVALLPLVYEAPVGVGSVPCFLCGTFLKNAQALKKHERNTCPRRPRAPTEPGREGAEANEVDVAAGGLKPTVPETGVFCENCKVYCKSLFVLSKHEPHCSQKPRCRFCGLYFYKNEHRDEHETDHCEANREDDFATVFPVSAIAVKPARAPKRKPVEQADSPVMAAAPAPQKPVEEEGGKEAIEAKKKKVEPQMESSFLVRKYGCMFCDHVFLSPSERNTHEVREHWESLLEMRQENRVRPRTRTFRCATCPMRFDSFAERSAHVAKEHTAPCSDTLKPEAIKVLVKGCARCLVCKQIYQSMGERDKHMDMEHSDVSLDSPVIKCIYCRKKFDTEEKRDDHMKMHSDRNYFNSVCFLCKKYFKTMEERNEHLTQEHEGHETVKTVIEAHMKKKFLTSAKQVEDAVERDAPEEASNDSPSSVKSTASTRPPTTGSQSSSGGSQENQAKSPVVCGKGVVKEEPPDEDDGLQYYDWRNAPSVPRAFFTCSFCPQRFQTAEEKKLHDVDHLMHKVSNMENRGDFFDALFREVSDVKPEVKEEPVDDVTGQYGVEPSGLLPGLPILQHTQVIAALAIHNSQKKAISFPEICLFSSLYFSPLLRDVSNLEEMIQTALEMPIFSKIGEKYEMNKSLRGWKKELASLLNDFHNEEHKRMDDEDLWPSMRAGRLKWDKKIA